MALDFTAASNVLKDVYQPAIREQINQQLALLMQVGQDTNSIEGQEAVVALHSGRNSGVGARAESGTLPTAGQQSYLNARIPVKYVYGRIQITGPIIEGMKSDTGSFTRAIESESKGIVQDLKRDVNRQCYTPSNGVIATAVTVTTGASGTITFATEAETRRLEVGMSVDIYDGDFAADDTAVTVDAVDVSTKTVTFDNLAAAVDAGDWIVRAGVVPAAVSSKATEDNQYEIHGLEDIVTDGVETSVGTDALAHPWLHGIDGTASTIWASTVKNASAAPTDSLFEEVMDDVYLDSGEDIDLIVTSHKASRAFAATQKSQKRFTNTTELKGGFSALTVQTGRGEVALWPERDCLDDVAFLLNTNHLQNWVMADWSFMDRDGAVLNRVSNQDAYEATVYRYHEFGTDRRNAHGVMHTLTV